MKKQSIHKNFANINMDEALKEKRKIDSHLVNLEFRKEQLLILIEKLYKISHQRVNLASKEQEQNIISKHISNGGAYLFSIGDQLKQAQKSRKEIEKEISDSKKQIESLVKLLKNNGCE